MVVLANVIIDGELWNYHVTKDGRVFSLNYRKTGKTKEAKVHKNDKGYNVLCLYDENGKQKTARVARLVATAYIPNPENKSEVDHINRVRADDRVENLRWVTHIENSNNKGEYPKNKKGSKPVKCIETGIVYPSVMEVTRQLGFNFRHISACCIGKQKTAYGFTWQYVV